tara:strand:+ start:3516 stop:4043 length:528 start_codon:yes stop_codon:yes gene_type:complete
MSCNTTLTSIIKGCENNAGGLKKVYIAPLASITEITSLEGTVSNIEMEEGSNYVEYDFNKDSANYIEEAGIDLVNGSTFFTTTLSLNIKRREVAKRNSIALLAGGQIDLSIIVLDSNGKYWLIGETGANLTGLGEGSGSVKADGSKYSLTFVAEEMDMIPEVDKTLFPDLLSPAV